MNFCRSYMRQRFDYPRMTPSRDASNLDAMQLQLLGYNVRVPTSLSEYYLPVDERLYKPNQG
jgi:ectoine hydroxylase-related dioxygenase (phytanoyl-CoA dioxygenase family)